MATIYNMVIVSHDETSTNDQRDLYAETGYTMLAGRKIRDFFKKCVSGAHPATIQTKINAVKASGTITFSSIANNDTITVAGTVFTAKTSGATGNQFNLGADDTAAAAAAVIAINASTENDGLVIATSALGVVTITALVPGELGNLIGLAISAHGSVSAALCAGGTNGDTETTHYFGSAS